MVYIKINSASSASSPCETPKSLISSQIHLQSCILAGGVSVGVSMSAVRHPWEAMIIGFAAAIISSIGFQYLKVFLPPPRHGHLPQACTVCMIKLSC